MKIPAYAELRCVSNFTFLRGASQPEELVIRAKELGYTALAIADECSMAGVVRAHVAAKETGLKLLLGAQFEVDWGLTASATTTSFNLTVLACNLFGYGNLCEFITKLRSSLREGDLSARYRGHRRHGARVDCVVVMNAEADGRRPISSQTVATWLLRRTSSAAAGSGVEQILRARRRDVALSAPPGQRRDRHSPCGHR